MMPDNFGKLGVNFNVPTIKSKFPYTYAVQDHLFYKGSMPSIEYYDNITSEEYNNLTVSY